MNEAFDRAVLCSLDQNVGAHDVVLGERKGISKRIVNVRLRGCVDYRVNLLRLKHIPVRQYQQGGGEREQAVERNMCDWERGGGLT